MCLLRNVALAGIVAVICLPVAADEPETVLVPPLAVLPCGEPIRELIG